MTPDEARALRQSDALTWLREHRHADPLKVAMDTKLGDHLPRRALAEQLRCRQKLTTKLPHWLEADCLFTQRAIEQASHHAVARYRASLLSGRVWDVAAGLGVDASAAAQAGCSVTVCECDPVLVQLLEHNAQALGISWRVRAGDGPALAIDHADNIDICIVDPDRRMGERRAIQLSDTKPDLSHWWPRIAQAGITRLLAKLAPACPAETAAALPGCHSLTWIGHGGECRELLVDCRADHRGPADLVALSVDDDGSARYRLQGPAVPLREVAPQPLAWIAEPESAVIRAGLVGNLAAETGMVALHPQVALLTSDHQPQHPGLHSWRIVDHGTYNPKIIRKAIASHGIKHVTIGARHFPHRPDDIAKKLKLRTGGGSHRLLCWRNPAGAMWYALGEA